MSTFNSNLTLGLVLLTLSACQSPPKPGPGTTSVADVAATPSAAPAANSYLQSYQQAIRSLKNGEPEAAVELLDKVIAVAPETIYVHTNLGLAHFNLQQLEQAEVAFQEAISHQPNDAVAHNHLGIIQRQKGDFEAARDRYQRAIAIDSDYALAYLNLGILFDIYLQDLEQALRQYQKYQALLNEENLEVSRWIVDIERRLKTKTASTEG